MTVTSSRFLNGHGIAEIPSGRKSPKPPPQIWYAAEPPFKGSQPAPSEAYKQTTKDTIIVIDNGDFVPLQERWLTDGKLTRFRQGQVLRVLDGPLTKHPEAHSPRMSRDIEIANSTELCHTLGTMHTQMRLQGDRLKRPLSLAVALWATGMLWKESWIRYLSTLGSKLRGVLEDRS